jgi:hypothetical protein
MNADRLSQEQLQTLMQHKSYPTTKRYINTARDLRPAVADLYVPDLGGAGAHSLPGEAVPTTCPTKDGEGPKPIVVSACGT